MSIFDMIREPMSLPSWERGLKFPIEDMECYEDIVAPLVGAWIEIFLGEYNYHFPQRRSPRGSVD